jgi:hypothetical protein
LRPQAVQISSSRTPSSTARSMPTTGSRPSSSGLSTIAGPVTQIHAELKGLRHGHSLARPGVVRSLSTELQELLLTSQGSLTGQADDVPRIIATLRWAIDALGQHERLHAQVEFNLLGEHSHPTLGTEPVDQGGGGVRAGGRDGRSSLVRQARSSQP